MACLAAAQGDSGISCIMRGVKETIYRCPGGRSALRTAAAVARCAPAPLDTGSTRCCAGRRGLRRACKHLCTAATGSPGRVHAPDRWRARWHQRDFASGVVRPLWDCFGINGMLRVTQDPGRRGRAAGAGAAAEVRGCFRAPVADPRAAPLSMAMSATRGARHGVRVTICAEQRKFGCGRRVSQGVVMASVCR